MWTRLASGLVGLAVVLPILVLGGPHGVFFLLLPFLVIGLDEYLRMTIPGLPLPERVAYLLTGLVVVSVAVHASSWLVPVLGLATMAFMLLPMFARADVEAAAQQGVRLGFGLLYIPVLLAPLALLRQQEQGVGLVFFLLAATWLGDTGAYFAGRAFGKTPLSPGSPRRRRARACLGA